MFLGGALAPPPLNSIEHESENSGTQNRTLRNSESENSVTWYMRGSSLAERGVTVKAVPHLKHVTVDVSVCLMTVRQCYEGNRIL